MKVFSAIKSMKVTTKLIIILLIIIYLVGFFSVWHIGQIFASINKVSTQRIEFSVTHFDSELIKGVYRKIENKKNY